MSPIICQICLRTDIGRPSNTDKRLVNFHEEICEFIVIHNPVLKFCGICEYQLKKFYNFQNKCRKALMILRSEVRQNSLRRDLHRLLPKSIGLVTATDRQAVYSLRDVGNNINILKNDVHLSCINIETNKQAKPVCVVIKVNQVSDKPVKDDTQIGPVSVEPDKDDTQIDPVSVGHDKDDTQIYPVSVEPDKDDTQIDPVSVEPDKDDTQIYPVSVEPDKDDTQIDPVSVEPDKDDRFKLRVYESNSDNPQVSNVTLLKKYVPLLQKNTELTDIVMELDDLIKIRDKSSVTAITNKEMSSGDDIVSEIKEPQITKDNDPSKKKERSLEKMIKRLVDQTILFLDQGKLDLGNVTITKEMFLEMFAKMDTQHLQFANGRFLFDHGLTDPQKIKKFVLSLHSRFDPKYETVFDIEYLNSREKKLAEFDARKHYKEYLAAKYKCELCFRVFEVKKLMDYHKKWHEPSLKYACDICPMRFKTRGTQLKHIRSLHRCVFRCKICTLLTHCPNSAEKHFDLHKGATYSCDICLSEYRSEGGLYRHRLTHTSFSCPHCARWFVSKLGLVGHTKKIHPDASTTEPMVSCDECDAEFVSRDILAKHMKKHKSPKPNICNFKCTYLRCMATFETSEDLRSHIKSYGHVRPAASSRLKPIKYVDTTPRNLKKTQPLYTICPVCEEQIPSRSAYRHHMKFHPEVPYVARTKLNYLCDECGKTFNSLCQYKDHQYVHKGVKLFPCGICGARFYSSSKLYMHKACHGPRLHQCKECGKTFKRSCNLYAHNLIHIGDRRFQCDVCSKSFLSRNALRAHIDGVHNKIRRVRKTVDKM